MKTVLVIAYLLGGNVIDTETIDSANMDECKLTRQMSLGEKTPVTTRYDSNVKISAECKQYPNSAS